MPNGTPDKDLVPQGLCRTFFPFSRSAELLAGQQFPANIIFKILLGPWATAVRRGLPPSTKI